MNAVIITLLLGFVTGIGTSIMVLHVVASIRDHLHMKKMRPMLDDLYPFVRMESVEKIEQMETTIKNEEIAA